MGEHSQLTDASIWSSEYSVTVTAACSALEFSGFLSAAILAFPASWPQRIAGLIGSQILLCVLNVVRVASLYLVGVHGLRAFALVHENLWPALMVVACVVAMTFWIQWAWRSR